MVTWPTGDRCCTAGTSTWAVARRGVEVANFAVPANLSSWVGSIVSPPRLTSAKAISWAPAGTSLNGLVLYAESTSLWGV